MLRKMYLTLFANLLFFTLPLIATPNTHLLQEKSDRIVGTWQGVLKVSGGVELRIVFHISKNDDGSFGAKLDSPDQGATGIPVGAVTFEENHLRIEVPSVAGKYEGDLKEESQTITGNWSQGGMSLPLKLKRIDKVEMPKRPQMPEKPYPYQEEEISYENKDAGITLAGTLTFPKTGGPFPGVVLITGSGPQNRDESLLGHKPFLVLADHLTRSGIAVLRFDDRGVGKSTGSFATATSEDFASDAMAGLQYLKSRDEIDAKKIGLIGHSEGGLIAPMVAAKSANVAFIVLMAGPGLTGEEILYLQTDLIAKANGASEGLRKRSRIDAENIYAIVKSESDNSVAEQKLRGYYEISWAEYSEELKAEAKKFGDPEKQMEANLKQILSPWFRYFLTYDPRSALQKVACPVLAINGEKDLQVPPKENLSAIAKALKKAGNTHFATKELAGLNHLFQTCETGAPAEYSKIEETFSPIAMNTISTWILENVK